tara:strand:- start:25876 stop:26892 length:1017 start_codon:yes stop_codon:yes gene_type:complete
MSVCQEFHLVSRKIWLLKLVLPIRYGRLLTGILLLSLLLPFFYLGAGEVSEGYTPALFFSLILAYIIPVFSFITAKSHEALVELRPILELDDQAFEQAQARLHSASPAYTVLCLVGGALAGAVHMSYIRGSVNGFIAEMVISVPGFMSTLGALMVWMVMTTVVAMLIRQTLLFARLGAHTVRVSLLNTRKLLPFARVSISATLAVIGALAFFPLIGLESGLDLAESLPGAIALLVPLLIMFITPVWPVQRRLAQLKERELAILNDKIEACSEATGVTDIETHRIDLLLPLLSYRREISQLSTWPFDVGNITRLTFYLIIPPLTWAGAALIEKVVDSLL